VSILAFPEAWVLAAIISSFAFWAAWRSETRASSLFISPWTSGAGLADFSDLCIASACFRSLIFTIISL